MIGVSDNRLIRAFKDNDYNNGTYMHIYYILQKK